MSTNNSKLKVYNTTGVCLVLVYGPGSALAFRSRFSTILNRRIIGRDDKPGPGFGQAKGFDFPGFLPQSL
jgi:hypothetical protein